jgi:hypothetical protein
MIHYYHTYACVYMYHVYNYDDGGTSAEITIHKLFEKKCLKTNVYDKTCVILLWLLT